MSEEEETQEVQEETSRESEETPASLVEETRQLVKQLKEENDRKEDLVLREEEAQVKETLGGRSEAGEKPKKETADEKWAREAKERYAGSGLDPTDDDTPVVYG